MTYKRSVDLVKQFDPEIQPGVLRTNGWVKVTNTEVLALNSSNVTIIPAPGENLALVVQHWELIKPAGTAYTIGSAGSIRLGPSNATNNFGGISPTNTMDQATFQARLIASPGTITTPVFSDYASSLRLNKATVLSQDSADMTGGDTPLYVRAWYYVFEHGVVPFP